MSSTIRTQMSWNIIVMCNNLPTKPSLLSQVIKEVRSLPTDFDVQYSSYLTFEKFREKKFREKNGDNQ